MTRPATNILIGDVRAMLKSLPERSVHVAVTSPPYWGLRAYGTDPQVWGGDEECEHEWNYLPYSPKIDGGKGFVDGGKVKLTQQKGDTYSAPSQTCQRCGCWKGELGSEPTIAQFLANMVDVFRCVWRVLRDDGTLWLNCGSSFISKTMESEEMVLREDLTAEEREHVFSELSDLFKRKAMPEMRQADAPAEQTVP